jgi:hypothetical protein
MNRFVFLVVAVVALTASGCGDGQLRVKGRLLKNGQPLVIPQTTDIWITFVSIPVDGVGNLNYYGTCKRSDGTFTVAGRDGTGMKPGKYRVAIQMGTKTKDELKGAFSEEKSPFIVDVDFNTSEIVLDLDNPPK